MLEPVEHQYEQIGYIARSHGVKGEVLLVPEFYAPTLFEHLDLVRLQNARGDLIPARVESVRVQEKNDRLTFFVKFDHVADRTQADELKNWAVFADRDVMEQLFGEEESPLDLASFDVWHDDRRVGSVTDIIDSPAQLILQVTTDQQDQLLIPFVDEYIVEVNEEMQRVQCQNLDQLTDL